MPRLGNLRRQHRCHQPSVRTSWRVVTCFAPGPRRSCRAGGSLGARARGWSLGCVTYPEHNEPRPYPALSRGEYCLAASFVRDIIDVPPGGLHFEIDRLIDPSQPSRRPSDFTPDMTVTRGAAQELVQASAARYRADRPAGWLGGPPAHVSDLTKLYSTSARST